MRRNCGRSEEAEQTRRRQRPGGRERGVRRLFWLRASPPGKSPTLGRVLLGRVLMFLLSKQVLLFLWRSSRHKPTFPLFLKAIIQPHQQNVLCRAPHAH